MDTDQAEGYVTPNETVANMDVGSEPTWTYSRRVSVGVTYLAADGW